jgi:hypothetical protein
MMKYVYDCQPLLAHLTVGGSTAHTVRTGVKPVAEGRQTCECECANPNPLTSMIPCTVRVIYLFLGISESTDQTSLSTRESLTAADDTKSVRLWSKPGRGCSSFDDYGRQYLLVLSYCKNNSIHCDHILVLVYEATSTCPKAYHCYKKPISCLEKIDGIGGWNHRENLPRREVYWRDQVNVCLCFLIRLYNSRTGIRIFT